MRIVLACIVGILAVAGGFGLRYTLERQPHTTVIEEPAVMPIAPTTPATASSTTQSNASITYKEIGEWITQLPTATRTGIATSLDLLKKRYDPNLSRSEINQYDSCTNFILEQSVQGVTSDHINALKEKPAAYAALITSADPSIEIIRTGIATALLNEYLMSDVMSAVGYNTVLANEQSNGPRSKASSRNSCATLPVPPQYK